MSLMVAVSRGLRAGWGQLSRASIQGLCWDTGDDGMNWERMHRWCASAQNITPMRMETAAMRVAYGRAVRQKYSRPQSKVHLGMPSWHLEPQKNYILGKPRLFSCASCMHKDKGERETGTGSDHPSADGAGSPKGPTAVQSAESERLEDSTEVQKLKDRIMYLEEELSAMTKSFNLVSARLEKYRLRTQNYITDAKIFGVTAICRELIKFYDALTSMKLQMTEKDAEFQSTKEVLSCLEDLETRLNNVFKKHDVSKIDAMGLPYNMYEHTIKGYVTRNELPHSTVVEVVQDGYWLQGRVIRHALVYVSMVERDKDLDLPTD